MLVQSIAPEARAIAYASRHDSDGFLAGELQRREALRYPPFSHLIRIVCAAAQGDPARAAASAVAESLRASLLTAPTGAGPSEAGSTGAGPSEPGRSPIGGGTAADGLGASVLGPAALFRLRGQERQVLVVKAAERRPAVRAAGEAVRRAADDRAHKGVSFSVDVDPQ